MSRRHYFNNDHNASTEQESGIFSKYLTDLEHKVTETRQFTMNNNAFTIPEKPKMIKRSYMEELKKQIEENEKKKLEKKLENLKPAINEEFYGYPNLPQTPEEVRRKRKLNQMQKVSKDLADQLAFKNHSINTTKYRELESIRTSNELDYQSYVHDKQNKLNKRKTERDVLVSCWNQAVKAKKLQKLLDSAERKGVEIRLDISESNELIKRKLNESHEYSSETDIKNTSFINTPHPNIDKNISKKSTKERAQGIKDLIDSKEKETYQYKIRKLVKDAKSQRNKLNPRPGRSVSPAQKSSQYVGKYLRNY